MKISQGENKVEKQPRRRQLARNATAFQEKQLCGYCAQIGDIFATLNNHFNRFPRFTHKSKSITE